MWFAVGGNNSIAGAIFGADLETDQFGIGEAFFCFPYGIETASGKARKVPICHMETAIIFSATVVKMIV